MHTAEFDIHHKGCWGSEIGVRFPKHAFSSIDCRWVGRHVMHILEAVGDRTDFSDIIRYLQSRNDVSKVEILSEKKRSLHLRIATKGGKHASQFSDMFFAHSCFPVAPTRFVKTSEIWTLGSASKKNILAAYCVLKRKHPVRIVSLRKDDFAEKLTDKQAEAIRYARLFGYYEWPRKRSVTAICALIGIPKTVFLSHLRKAEKKIIGEYVNRP